VEFIEDFGHLGHEKQYPDPVIIPEPGTVAMLVFGGFALLLLLWRRRTV